LSLCPLSASLSTAFSHLSVSPHSDNLHRVLEDVADRYITFALGSPPPLDQAGIRVSTWNLTSLSPLSGGYKNKLVSNLASERIVCLQETKMSVEDARLLQLQIPGCLVVSTPCLYEEADIGLSSSQNSREEASSSHTQAPSISTADHSQRHATGGVAVLLPTYLCSTQVSTHELIPGYAVAATFAMRTFAWCVVSVYLRPKHEKRLLAHLTTELNKLLASSNYDSFLILGDFNQARKLHEWEVFISVFDVTDLLPFPTNTFQGPNGPSPPDTCLAPASLFDHSLWTSRFRLIQRKDSKYGHNCVIFDLKPASGGHDRLCPAYKRLSDDIFKGTSPQRRVLPLLCQLYAPQIACPEQWLDNVHAFFLAYSKTIPVCHKARSYTFLK
jgi:exonuclease III